MFEVPKNVGRLSQIVELKLVFWSISSSRPQMENMNEVELPWRRNLHVKRVCVSGGEKGVGKVASEGRASLVSCGPIKLITCPDTENKTGSVLLGKVFSDIVPSLLVTV